MDPSDDDLSARDRPVPVAPRTPPDPAAGGMDPPDGFEDPTTTGATAEPPPAPPVLSLFPRWARIAVLPVVAIALVGSLIRVPYFSLGPGPVTDVLPLVKVSGATTYPSEGQLLLTTASVSNSNLTLWDVVWTWINPDIRMVRREAIISPGVSDEEQRALNQRDMEESKQSAEVAAFRALGMEVTRIAGARVLTVIAGSPADGKFQRGDLVVAVDGTRVASPEEAVEQIRRRTIGEKVKFTVRRGGGNVTLEAELRPSLGDPNRPAVGVTLARAFRLPHQIDIDIRRVGGPSGGLVFALSIVDAFTEEDLTRGHTIAATGTIMLGADGVARVGPIGAIGEKVRAARDAGVDVFLVPAEGGEAEAARAIAPPGMRIVPVATLDQALTALRELPPAKSR